MISTMHAKSVCLLQKIHIKSTLNRSERCGWEPTFPSWKRWKELRLNYLCTITWALQSCQNFMSALRLWKSSIAGSYTESSITPSNDFAMRSSPGHMLIFWPPTFQFFRDFNQFFISVNTIEFLDKETILSPFFNRSAMLFYRKCHEPIFISYFTFSDIFQSQVTHIFGHEPYFSR